MKAFMPHQNLCQPLQALQQHQGLGSAVTGWKIHRVNGSQVSQLRNEHEDFLLLFFFFPPGIWAGESLVGILGVLKSAAEYISFWGPGL